jgi:aspartate aminotransferase-like enzyme
LSASLAAVRFELATPRDFDAIRRLNHRTFAEEIPQHPVHDDRRLVDRFERDSVFIVARAGTGLVGMLSVRPERPFSLEAKLPEFERFLPPGRRICEVRLLSVEPSHRQGIVLRGLLVRLVRECDARGLDLAVISATTRQLRLYRHLGCVPFGHLVGSPGAQFQPMYVTREALVERVGSLLDAAPKEPRCFLTGPVSLSAPVRARLAAPLTSHRGTAFATDCATIRDGLRALTGAEHVAVLNGSGTLANDVVASQIAARGGRVVILANGEFGERLVNHAERHAIPHLVVRRPWGTVIDADTVRHTVRRAGASWIWATHCETSTGMLLNLAALRDVAAETGARLALDAASSVGTVATDFNGVALASTVSGKALGAVAGLAIVCADEVPRPCPTVPRALDLASYLTGDGVPFTQSSLLVGALASAIASTDWRERFAAIAAADSQLRARLAAAGVAPLVSGPSAAPAVATWPVPAQRQSVDVGAAMERAGFQISWQSSYLRERGWIQTALMGAFDADAVAPMADTLATVFGAGVTSVGGGAVFGERGVAADEVDQGASRVNPKLLEHVREVGTHRPR